MSRRRFCRLAGAALVGAAAPGAGLRATVVPALTGRGIVARALRPATRVEILPEYDRSLERVLLSIPSDRVSLDAGAGAASPEPAPPDPFLHAVYREFIAVLPDYSRLEVAVHEAALERAHALMADLAPGRPVQFHGVDDAATLADLWSQDLGEAIRVDGADRFLVSMPVDDTAVYNSAVAHNRLRVARAIFGADRVLEADFAFEGGNVTFDRTERGLRVFVGFNDVLLTQRSYASRGARLSTRQVAERMSRSLGGAEVVVVGDEPQSRSLPHLDQAFIILAGGVAVVNQLAGDARSAEQRQLRQCRLQLDALGYRTLVIECRPQDVRRYQASTNAIPFVDRETDERRIIFPVFPDEVRLDVDGALSHLDLVGKGRAAYAAYAAAGYRPIPVRDYAYVAGGSTHCISNALQ